MPNQAAEPKPNSLPTTAMLWDFDNIAPPREHLASLAQALWGHIGPGVPLIAAAHRATFRSCRTMLADLGIELLSGGRRRNGSDRLLLDHAKALQQQGVTHFIVASNDYRFRRIATFAELHVLTLSASQVSDRLRAAALSVSVLERDHEGWHVELHCGAPQQLGTPC
jgi:hypothetical protein